MKYLIEFPDVIRDYKGNEYEPTGEYRIPKTGEWYWNDDAAVLAEYSHYSHYPILRPKWTWPLINGEPLKGWGFAMDSGGSVWLYENDPGRSNVSWGPCHAIINASTLSKCLPNFTPPTITDWTVPVLNPHWKAS